MDLETLKTFIFLAKTKNFTRTANQLFVAQSTVTNRINELEKELQISLFSRNNRVVELTPEGDRFLLYAEKVIDLTNSSLAEISSFHKFKNHLIIGTTDSIYNSHLSDIILDHTLKHKEDSLKIIIGVSSNLIEQLEANIIDIAFSYLPLNKSNFKCELYREDPLILVTDYGNMKYQSGITREELLKINYLMCNFALQDVGQFIRNIFPKYHQFSLEIDDCSKIIPFLLFQDNYTFIPKDMAAPYIKKRQLREIPLKDLETPVINSYIIGKKNRIEQWNQLFGNIEQG